MSLPVFKTGGSGDPRPAGSIPVRLRQAPADSPDARALSHPPAPAALPGSSIPVRLRHFVAPAASPGRSAVCVSDAESPPSSRLLPGKLDMRHETRDENEIDGRIAKHLLGDADVAALRVMSLWSHGSTLARLASSVGS